MKNNLFKIKIKIGIVVFIYACLIFVYLGSFTPYKVTETYFSAQNVPHTMITERGYNCIFDIGYRHNEMPGGIKMIKVESIDYLFASLQFIITSAVAVAIILFILHKEKRKRPFQKSEKDLNTNNTNEIKKPSGFVHIKTSDGQMMRVPFDKLDHFTEQENAVPENMQPSLFDLLEESED